MASDRQMSLWDLLTFMSAAGAPMGAYEAAKAAGMNLWLRICCVAGGLAVGILCMWFIRVSVFRLAQCLFGWEESLGSSRTNLTLKAVHILLYALTVAWVFISMFLGDWLAKMFIDRFRV
jgi:hypothetical protein